jgi:hypothetical protein
MFILMLEKYDLIETCVHPIKYYFITQSIYFV